MKQELIILAGLLLKITCRNHRHVISQYISAVNKNDLNLALIVSDEIMDYFIETDAGEKRAQLSEKLYDKTMEYYKLNETHK